MQTPIQKIKLDTCKNNIFVKREDLLPFSFGGNKVRIAYEFFDDMISKGKNCMICYGNARSNLCRVISNLCYSRNIKCFIISPSDDNGERHQTFNSKMCTACHAEFRYSSKTNVSEVVQSVIDECKSLGYDPYYIYGDIYGNGNEAVPTRAYEKVYSEIMEQKRDSGIDFDYIFLATGTGMTQAGLLVGQKESLGTEKIVGISVARDKETAKEKVKKYIEALSQDEYTKAITVEDSYRCGGYGIHGSSVISVINKMLTENGISLDPTYTGKAFAGMCKYLKENGIHSKNVLFIHTGGTPLYFDFLYDFDIKKANIQMLENNEESVSKMEYFLTKYSAEFAVPLTERIDIHEYTKKILANGYAFVALNSLKEVEGLVCGYANDAVNLTAFESVFVTAPETRGSGIAEKLFKTQFEYCRSCGMTKIVFSTNRNNKAARKFYEKMGIPINEEIDDSSAIHYEYVL